MRLVLLAVILPTVGFGQRVVDQNAPWRREAVGVRMRDAMADLAAPIQDGEFVRRDGAMLTLGSKPFRFHGNNVYYNQADVLYGRTAGVEETYDKMAALGLSVARVNGHNDNDRTKDPAAIQLSPGVYSEASLVALDRSIALAKSRNLRLIVKLTNNWEAYGGIRRYVFWHLGRTPSNAEASLFYTEPRIKGWFRDFARMLIDRRNTVTGLTYRDEPAILAWELGNELRNPTGGKANDLVAWMGEMAAFLKQIDSNHLVADGGEGFDDSPGLYPGLSNRYTVSGSDGCSYHRLVQIPELDLVSYHLYPAGWNMNDGADAFLFIRRHEELAREAGKVAYLGEYGKRAGDKSPAGCSREPGRAFDPARSAVFQSWIQAAALEQASAGVMVWQLINDGKDDCEGFQVYCPQDGASCGVMRQASESISATPVVVSAATYAPLKVASGSLATLFGSGLAGARVVLVDVAGKVSETAASFSGDSQINFQVPESFGPGAAVVRVVRNSTTVASTAVTVATVAPGIFTASADGKGLAAGATAPITVPGYLSLYGTGIRGHGDMSKVTATVGGIPAPVLYAGAQAEFAGLDQVNLQLPAELAGAGEVEVRLTVAGSAANPVVVTLR